MKTARNLMRIWLAIAMFEISLGVMFQDPNWCWAGLGLALWSATAGLAVSYWNEGDV